MGRDGSFQLVAMEQVYLYKENPIRRNGSIIARKGSGFTEKGAFSWLPCSGAKASSALLPAHSSGESGAKMIL